MITFFVKDEHKSIAMAAGIDVRAERDVPACALSVGDIVTFPESPQIAFKVMWRWLRSAGQDQPAAWYVTLQPCEHPLD